MRFRTRTVGLACAVAAWLLFPEPAAAQSLDSGDTAWMAVSTVLVLFLTIPGLALFYGGMVRASSVVSVMSQCFGIACLVTILWVVVGYSLAFGDSLLVLGDVSKIFYQGVSEHVLWGTIPESVFATFQLAFAIAAAALYVGTFVERTRFTSVLVFTAFWSLLVYAPITHWIWGGGWLGRMGLMDYAGGIVVNVTAGTTALMAIIILGPRPGFPEQVSPPHNIPLTMTGAGMLWLGWMGFSGGSAVAADGNATLAMAVTHMSASAGAFTWLLLERARHGRPKALGAAIGMVAGLAAVTPAAGFVGPVGALVIGTSAGLLCFATAAFFRNVLGLDDSMDVVSAHLIGGVLGAMLAGVLSSRALGLLGGQEDIFIFGQLRVQLIGVLAAVTYTAAMSWLILRIINCRPVSATTFADGMDATNHEEQGYVLENGRRSK